MWKRLMASVHFRWLYYAFLATVLRVLFGFYPEMCEQLYARGVFLLLRMAIDYSVGWLPFAAIYWIIFFAVAWVVLRFGHILFIWRHYTWWQRIGYGLGSLWVFLCRLWVLFLLMWGYNYARVPLETQLGLDARPLTHAELLAEVQWVQKQAAAVRKEIPFADTSALTAAHYVEFDTERMMRLYLEDALNEWGYPTWGSVRCRQLVPDGILLRFSTSGVYLPWTGEGHIDHALHPIRKPFTMAHEMGHGYGFGDEAVCNFLGYVACLKSPHPAIRYSGLLMYWQYAASELRDIDEEGYKRLREQLDAGIAADLRAIRAVSERYPPLMQNIQQAAYNAYLKSQGVKEGVLSYDRMVVLTAAWYRAEIFYER